MAWLLDTHTLIWFTDKPELLSKTARSCIEDSPDEVFVSAASFWEIAIKRSIGKLDLPVSSAQLLEMTRKNETPILDISGSHAVIIEDMPLHHRDPFDRILAAQALAEDLTLVSRDTVFDLYGVKRLW